MHKAMGNQYVSQPDVPRTAWADVPIGGDDDFADAFDTNGLTNEAEGLAHPMAGVAPMAVDQTQQQGSLPTQTYVPPDTQSVQAAILDDVRDKAKAAGRSQADKAAGGKQSPARTNSPDQVQAELSSRPQRTR